MKTFEDFCHEVTEAYRKEFHAPPPKEHRIELINAAARIYAEYLKVGDRK